MILQVLVSFKPPQFGITNLEIDPENPRSSGCWVIATDMGIELESPDCYAVVEATISLVPAGSQMLRSI